MHFVLHLRLQGMERAFGPESGLHRLCGRWNTGKFSVLKILVFDLDGHQRSAYWIDEMQILRSVQDDSFFVRVQTWTPACAAKFPVLKILMNKSGG
jgi:hypothetical protein